MRAPLMLRELEAGAAEVAAPAKVLDYSLRSSAMPAAVAASASSSDFSPTQ